MRQTRQWLVKSRPTYGLYTASSNIYTVVLSLGVVAIAQKLVSITLYHWIGYYIATNYARLRPFSRISAIYGTWLVALWNLL